MLNLWQKTRLLGRMLAPAAMQALAALAPAAIYSPLSFGQGEEVLSQVAESALGSAVGISRASAFFWIANGLAGLAIWWTARVMLEFKFDGHAPGEDLPPEFRRRVQLWWPRLLGVVPVLIVAVKLFLRSHAYEGGGSIKIIAMLRLLAAQQVLLAVLLLAFFLARRVWLRQRRESEPGRGFQSFAEMRRASPETVWIHGGLFVVALGVLAAVWLSPLGWTAALGTGAMISLAGASWVTIGTQLMHLRASTGAPVFALLALGVLFFSQFNDNHFVRLTPQPLAPESRTPVAQAITDWRGSVGQSTAHTAAHARPVFIVATEGGGIRAAYWTATVLGNLQERSRAVAPPPGTPLPPDFASHLFAISGISGGSVGAAVFDVLYAGQKEPLTGIAQSIFAEDHLAPLMGGLLFPETVQRFWPWVLPGTDRGAIFEHSLEKACRQYGQTDRFEQPFHDLWKAAPHHVPHLLLNSTLVETGQRIIFSDLAITDDFLAAREAVKSLFPRGDRAADFYDVPLSTAAHAGARFTYTNPQGTLGTGEHFVDGGYFENSGATTALELLQMAEPLLAAVEPAEIIVPVVILISNAPRPPLPAGGLPPKAVSDEPRPPSREKISTASSTAIDLLAPPEALLHTRDARGDLALAAIRQFQAQAVRLPQDHPATQLPRVIEFSLLERGIPLPLGWSLSKAAADEMRGQIDEEARGDAGNGAAIRSVLAWLALAAQP